MFGGHGTLETLEDVAGSFTPRAALVSPPASGCGPAALDLLQPAAGGENNGGVGGQQTCSAKRVNRPEDDAIIRFVCQRRGWRGRSGAKLTDGLGGEQLQDKPLGKQDHK